MTNDTQTPVADAGPLDQPVGLNEDQFELLKQAMRRDEANDGYMKRTEFHSAALRIWLDSGRTDVELGSLQVIISAGMRPHLTLKPNSN